MFVALISPGAASGILGQAECKNGGTPTGTCLIGTSPVPPPRCKFGFSPAIDD